MQVCSIFHRNIVTVSAGSLIWRIYFFSPFKPFSRESDFQGFIKTKRNCLFLHSAGGSHLSNTYGIHHNHRGNPKNPNFFHYKSHYRSTSCLSLGWTLRRWRDSGHCCTDPKWPKEGSILGGRRDSLHLLPTRKDDGMFAMGRPHH